MTFKFKLPDIGEGVVEGEIVRWLIRPGDTIEEDQPMVEIMTDKATVEIPSPVRGQILDLFGDEGDIVEVGATLVQISTEDGTPEEVSEPREKTPPFPATKSPPPAPVRGKKDQVLATPAIRKLAREMDIDLSTVTGTGPGGRITREDLEGEQEGGSREQPSHREAAGETRSTTAQRIPYRGLRRKIGQHLVTSKQRAPHFTYVEEVDATELVRLRKEYSQVSESDVPLTYLPFLVKASVLALKKFPIVNSTLVEEDEQIVLNDSYNVGIATATDDGLVVPVVKEADLRSIPELASELGRLADCARQGTLKVNELQGSTFTITSLGALGGIMATPIINYPEVAILGVHKIVERPVVREGQVAIRQMMNLSLTCDHRIVDGAVAAAFVQHIKRLIETPALLFL